ncbi:DUF4262 domain-containing protein [Azovibrio restrictus]|uniref:DUF4262 domain-containing protein n=1 Tax=Azovibrio restrictus TaxID=146938 RepID=UPI00047CDA9F|nr:DUF4262 domain-containing protein [Azovibrio restrictus]
MSEFAENVRHDIETFGCSIIFIGDDEPPFAYTVGLWLKHKHPELITFGLAGETMGNILMRIASMVGEGTRFSSATRLQGVGGKFGVEVHPVAKANLGRYCGFALGFYEEKFPLAQVVWPDNAGHFPSEREYNHAYAKLQPLL